MSADDLDWGRLSQVWNAPDPGAGARTALLLRAVRRQTRRLWLVLALEALLTVLIFVPVVRGLAADPSPRLMFLAGAAVLHTAVIWGYAWWNRRGYWHPFTGTVRDAVAHRRRHLARRLRAVGFVRRLCLTEAALMVPVGLALTRMAPSLPPQRTAWVVLTAAGVLGLAVAWARWEGARVARELTDLEALGRELDTAV